MCLLLLLKVLTIRLDSELVDVLALPSDRKTVKAAAKCLKASVSWPPPATENSCLNNNMLKIKLVRSFNDFEKWKHYQHCVFPLPDEPVLNKNLLSLE